MRDEGGKESVEGWRAEEGGERKRGARAGCRAGGKGVIVKTCRARLGVACFGAYVLLLVIKLLPRTLSFLQTSMGPIYVDQVVR